MSISKLREFLPWILAGSLIVASLYLWYLSGSRVGRHISSQPDSILICGTIERPDGKIPGRVNVMEFKRILDRDGLVLTVEDSQTQYDSTIRLRVCE